MEKLLLFIINTFLSVFFTMFIFCSLLQLQFSIIYVILETILLVLLCYRFPKSGDKK